MKQALFSILLILILAGCGKEKVEMPTDPNSATAMAIVETARTEAQTKADIEKMMAMVELFCIGGAIACVGGILLSKFFGSKLAMGLCIIGVLTFVVGWGLVAAKIQYPKTIATIGLVMLLSVFAAFIVVAIINRKAFVQIVIGNENLKESLGSWEDKTIIEQFQIEQRTQQTKTTEKLVDNIRKEINGG